jgi:hypothetical protein
MMQNLMACRKLGDAIEGHLFSQAFIFLCLLVAGSGKENPTWSVIEALLHFSMGNGGAV